MLPKVVLGVRSVFKYAGGIGPGFAAAFGSNVTDRDLEIDRDMEHESDTDYPLINKRYLNNEHSN